MCVLARSCGETQEVEQRFVRASLLKPRCLRDLNLCGTTHLQAWCYHGNRRCGGRRATTRATTKSVSPCSVELCPSTTCYATMTTRLEHGSRLQARWLHASATGTARREPHPTVGCDKVAGLGPGDNVGCAMVVGLGPGDDACGASAVNQNTGLACRNSRVLRPGVVGTRAFCGLALYHLHAPPVHML